MTGPRLPEDRQQDLARARRLEWWTIGWMASVIAAMGLASGTSQAMRTAWVEDFLSLVPPAVFLIAARFEARAPTPRFPFGFTRVNSLGFLVAAVALTSLGALLLVNAAWTLIAQDRVTIGGVDLFGRQVWAGWPMVAALAYSVVPPLILGRLKLPPARALQDKVLHTDAMMNRADWSTGLAGIAGVIGVGYGLWWADAAAAAAISLSVLHDGIKALRSATAELVDGAPRALDSDAVAPDAQALHDALAARHPGARIRMRETGRFIRVVIDDEAVDAEGGQWPGEAERSWRLASLSQRVGTGSPPAATPE
jgi:cobalt-zinc-cadmium efflux system protein